MVEGRTDVRTGGLKEGREYGRKDGRMEGRTDGRTCICACASASRFVDCQAGMRACNVCLHTILALNVAFDLLH